MRQNHCENGSNTTVPQAQSNIGDSSSPRALARSNKASVTTIRLGPLDNEDTVKQHMPNGAPAYIMPANGDRYYLAGAGLFALWGTKGQKHSPEWGAVLRGNMQDVLLLTSPLIIVVSQA